MHLVDTYVQSKSHCIQRYTLDQCMLSLEIGTMTLVLLAPCYRNDFSSTCFEVGYAIRSNIWLLHLIHFQKVHIKCSNSIHSTFLFLIDFLQHKSLQTYIEVKSAITVNVSRKANTSRL